MTTKSVVEAWERRFPASQVQQKPETLQFGIDKIALGRIHASFGQVVGIAIIILFILGLVSFALLAPMT